MNEKNLVICDREIQYATILAENFSKREELAVKVHVCSSVDVAKELLEVKDIHILLIDECFLYEERCKIGAGQVFVLGRGKVSDLHKEEYQIGKYQSADRIIGEVFDAYVQVSSENILRSSGKNRTKLVAVYSPIQRIGKTRFSIALGKAWALKKRVLYLNLETYSGLEKFDEGQNLGDLLYYIRQGMGNLGLRIQASVRKMEELDCLNPIPMATDLKEITLREWESLLEQISECEMYDIILLDISESVQGVLEILNACDRIYMPVLEDEISVRKLKQFDRNTETLKLERIKHVTYRFLLPEKIEEYAKIRAKEEL